MRDLGHILSVLAVAAAVGCGDSPEGGWATAPSKLRPVRAVVETPLPPRTPLEDAIKATFQREFGEPVFRPAIFNDERSTDCRGNGHLASTVYLNTVAGRSRLLFVYTSRDGARLLRREERGTVIRPAGRFRALVVLLTYPETFTSESLGLWETAQAMINEDHAAFARSRGFAEPIVSFESTNVLIPGNEVPDPNSPSAMMSELARRGFSVTSHDFLVTINVDPAKAEGGLAVPSFGPAWVYVGNYGRYRTRLTQTQLYYYAATVYHHEVAHHWGWVHDWSPSCGSVPPEYAPLISAPILFGWEDTDGDRVPEILDSTPYGRSR